MRRERRGGEGAGACRRSAGPPRWRLPSGSRAQPTPSPLAQQVPRNAPHPGQDIPESSPTARPGWLEVEEWEGGLEVRSGGHDSVGPQH